MVVVVEEDLQPWGGGVDTGWGEGSYNGKV